MEGLNLAAHIEHTCLKPDSRQEDIDQVIREAIGYGFHGICIPPFWVKHARRELGNTGPRLVTVVGFPMGYQLTESKLDEMTRLMEMGADEIDLVWNLSAFKTGMPWTKIELARCTQHAHASQRLIKVILETGLLTAQETEDACRMCADAGADFVKTSTGFAGKGPGVELIKKIRKLLPANVGIKASGGIRTAHQALALIKAGADRIGTSSGKQIMDGQGAA